MSLPHSNQKDDKERTPKTYLIGSIDQVRSELPCCPYSSSLVCRELATGLDALIAIPCKRWGCKWCGQRKAFQLAMRCETAKPTRMITLTVDPKRWIHPNDAYKGTRRKIADFAKHLRKRLDGFAYFRVLEATKAGWPHYHFLARCRYIPQGDLSRIWATMTGATIVDVRAIKNDTNVFKYVLKYLCKQQHIPWTNRRISWSHDFFPKNDEQKPRQNPYVNRVRDFHHPSEILSKKYFRKTIEQRRPNVWVILDSESPQP